MSSRADIDGGRLIYTCNCGWVDLGHANPKRTTRPYVGALALWDQLKSESGWSSEFDDGYLVLYSQDMGKWGFTVGVTRSYFVRRGLSTHRRESIALAIFMEVSRAFENMQGSVPEEIPLFGPIPGLSRIGESSFSQEDLVSNLIGFYKAVRPQTDYLSLCGAVSKEASKQVWDSSGSVGSIKNKKFTPIFHPCKDCASPGVFPAKLQEIQPAAKEPFKKGVEFRDWSTQDTPRLGVPRYRR